YPSVQCKILDLPTPYKSIHVNDLKAFTEKTNLSDYSYFLFSPKLSKFFEVNRKVNSNALSWVEKLVSTISYKEELYFSVLENPSRASTSFWSNYEKDSLFYKKENSKNYLIPSEEVSLFFPGRISK